MLINHLRLEEFHSTRDHVIQHPSTREPASKKLLLHVQVVVKPVNPRVKRTVVAPVLMLHDGDARFLEAQQYLEDDHLQQGLQPLRSSHQLMQELSLTSLTQHAVLVILVV